MGAGDGVDDGQAKSVSAGERGSQFVGGIGQEVPAWLPLRDPGARQVPLIDLDAVMR